MVDQLFSHKLRNSPIDLFTDLLQMALTVCAGSAASGHRIKNKFLVVAAVEKNDWKVMNKAIQNNPPHST